MIYFSNKITEEELENLGTNVKKFILEETDAYTGFTGTIDGIFSVKVSKTLNPHWRDSLADFINYEQLNETTILLDIDEKDYLDALNHDVKNVGTELRDYEPEILIHSTPLSSWESIKKSGYLKSWNCVKKENPDFETEPIGAKLGDLEDYRDYIMFSDGNVMAEVVVASKEKGYIEMDVNAPYTPGARLYLDAKKMAKDGLLVRDGIHLPKIKNEILLAKYLIWPCTAADLKIDEISTPLEFTKTANERFEALFGRRI